VKILALSDVYTWDGCGRLVDKCRPDVVVLAGDLTSNGAAAFWDEAFELIPDFRRERRALYERVRGIKRSGNTCIICKDGPTPPYEKCELNRHADFFVLDHLRQLERYFVKSKAFAAVHKRIHVDKFYGFLRHAGQRAAVLVVKGDHDEDFPGSYDADRINEIPGCREISGRTYEFGSEFFLGVSFQLIAYRRIAKSLLAQFPQRGGIVVAHARKGNVQLLAELKPKLIVRGHSGRGIRRICGVPAVLTDGAHAIIDIGKSGLPRIRQLDPPEPLATRVHPIPG
jgi:hypothetical protein